MRRGLAALCVLLAPALGHAADEPPGEVVKSQLKILTELNLAGQTIEGEAFGQWGRSAIDRAEAIVGADKSRRDVVIQVVLHTKRAPEASIAGRPALKPAEAEKLIAALKLAEAPHAKVVPFAFRIEMKVSGGHPAPDLPLVPPLDTPEEARLGRLEKAGTAERLALLKEWATEEALPGLAAVADASEAKFEGVRHLGAAISALDPARPIDVAKLTDGNPDYWRALVEMAPGNPLVPTVKVALLVARGELDHARRLAEVSSLFDARQAAASRVLGDARVMLNLFHKDVEAAIRAGVAAHDRQRYDEAIAAFDQVLKSFPGSAWARYERFQTRRVLALAKGRNLPATDWPKAAQEIYACDPLFAFGAEAGSGAEAYRLFRRMALNELFKDQTKLREDVVKYADIALDLEHYAFAAHVYWNAVTAIEPKFYGGRNLVEYFLYCLERLGIKGLKDNFKGIHAAEFARIAAERKKLMEESPLYQKMRKEK